MPLTFPDAGLGELAEALLELVGEDDSHDDVLHRRADRLADGQSGGNDIARMARIFFPVDVVEVEGADHERS